MDVVSMERTVNFDEELQAFCATESQIPKCLLRLMHISTWVELQLPGFRSQQQCSTGGCHILTELCQNWGA